MYTREQGKLLLKHVRKAIELYIKEKKLHRIDAKEPILNEKVGLFVTLHSHAKSGKELRGCIGFVDSSAPLRETVPKAALSAAFRDTRFSPLTAQELDKITAEISLLSRPEMIKATDPQELLEKIAPGVDGLILKKGPYQGLFLPQVWEQLPDKEDFLANLCFKAGVPNPRAWADADAQLFKFRVQAFEEEGPRGGLAARGK